MMIEQWKLTQPKEPESLRLRVMRWLWGRNDKTWLLQKMGVPASRWLGEKGMNGGVICNGTVLSIVSLQLLLWIMADKVVFAIQRTLPLKPGRRKPGSGSNFIDRLIGWSIENGAVFTLCNLRSLLPHVEPVPDTPAVGTQKTVFFRTIKHIVRNICISIVSNMIAEEGAVWLLHIASQKLYRHVPYFANQRRSASPFEFAALLDWLQGNSLLQIFGGGIALGVIESFVPSKIAEELVTTPFNFLRFVRNGFFFRFIFDLVFYFAHAAMHINPFLYRMIHKRHHEHFTTNLRTNYHFTALDLFIESALPMFTSLASLRALGVKMGRYEIHAFLTYTAWHESCTHLGKPMPVVSMFPPLSILYNGFFNLDRTIIESHEVHHNRRNCNYGIMPWIDMVLGTCRALGEKKDA
jgi:sterol desaturase/sphingolipid hydroxylase (fatty acid hydroxylase superfamily)